MAPKIEVSHSWYWQGRSLPKSQLRGGRSRPIQLLPVDYEIVTEKRTRATQRQQAIRVYPPAERPSRGRRETRDPPQSRPPSGENRTAGVAPRRCCSRYCIGHGSEVPRNLQGDVYSCVKGQPPSPFDQHPAKRQTTVAPARARPRTPSPATSTRTLVPDYCKKCVAFHVPCPHSRRESEIALVKSPRVNFPPRPATPPRRGSHTRRVYTCDAYCSGCQVIASGVFNRPLCEMSGALRGHDNYRTCTMIFS